MRFVTCMGCLFRLTDKQFREQMLEAAAGNGFHAGVGQCVDTSPVLDVTDITAEDAQEEVGNPIGWSDPRPCD
jgi:hypothetical protein